MKKYRLKSSQGRIFGPLHLNEIIELHKNLHLDQEYLVQVFPIGDWLGLNNFPEILEIIKEPEVVVTTPESTDEDSTEFREFKYERKSDDVVDYSALEKKISIKKEENEKIEKTQIVKINKNELIEKTRIVSRPDLEQALIDDVSESSEDELTSSVIVDKVIEEEIDFSDKTMVGKSLEIIKHKNDIETKDIEREIELALIPVNKEIQKKNKAKVNRVVIEQPKKKVRLFIILFVVFAVLFMLPDEKTEESKISYPNLSFPIAKKVVDKSKASEYFNKGLEVYRKDTYSSLLKSSKLFLASLENKFQDNPSLAYVILTYSELLSNSKNALKDGKIINQLINIAGSAVYNDSNIALGAANYYSYFEKPYAAINILESYLAINRPTPKLYAKYLSLLLDVGNYKDATKAYEIISKQKISDVDVLEVFVKYLLLFEKQDEAIELLNTNNEQFKDSMKFYVIASQVFLRKQDFEKLKIMTNVLVTKYGGGSPLIMANTLKFLGYIKIYENKYKESEAYFVKSLEVYETKELKDILGKLYEPGSNINNDIIINSKIELLINKSKKEANSQNWEKAFLYALEASDINENSLNAKLYLASLQSKRGYFNYAIETLEKLKNKYPQDIKIAFELIMANLRAYKLNDAKMHIVNYSTSIEFKNSFEYLALLGHYYSMVGNYKMSFDRFQGALVKNPLRDDIYFEMAKIAFSVKKFDKCKEFLSEAMKLDPFNFYYKILFSKVLYELDDVNTAIGYIRNELKSNPDNPQLLGQIAIYYFRDQNYSEYKLYKEKLSRLSRSDESLYEYLLESAILEKNNKEIISNGDQLLLLAPGKLEVRMKVAQAYTETGDYQKAINMLNTIEQRLDSYPRVNYNKAKIYLLINDYKNVVAAGMKEIEISPNSELGYYITGEGNLKLEKYDEAKKNLEKAIQIKPDNYDTLLALGWLKTKQGYYAAARELYLRALRQNDMDPELHKRLGEVYKDIGQSQMAIEQYKIYLKLNPAAKDRNIINNIINQLQ